MASEIVRTRLDKEKKDSSVVMQAQTTSIMQANGFDVHDFLDRWKKARISALLGFFPTEVRAQSDFEVTNEEFLLKKVAPFDYDKILRRVFDQSRKFGLSASRFIGMSFETIDIKEILENSTIPCLRGSWIRRNSAFVSKRRGCVSFDVHGSLACDYWREALDGLVMGVGENERIARHSSVGHGDAECLDILFAEEFNTPRVVSPEAGEKSKTTGKFKYGEISAEMKEKFLPVFEKLKKMKVDLTLEGLSEGKLYYRLDPESGVLCGAGGKLMHDNFSRHVKEIYPHLSLIDAAPLAVYGGST